MTSPRDRELWDQIGHLFEGRPGWRLEAQSTPGAPRTWCFGSAGKSELSVSVDGGRISVYLIERDQDVALPDVDARDVWLEANEARFTGHRSVTSEFLDDLTRGHGSD